MPEKGLPVFLEYDQAALDSAYDQAAYAPNREQLIERRIRDSANVRGRIGEPERIAYGTAEIERLDIYRSARPAAPVFMFIHGGAWRSGRSKDFAGPAEMFLAAGAHYVVPGTVDIEPLDLGRPVGDPLGLADAPAHLGAIAALDQLLAVCRIGGLVIGRVERGLVVVKEYRQACLGHRTPAVCAAASRGRP